MEKRLRTVIIDDESLARRAIIQLLKKYPGIVIEAECANGFEGVKAIQELKPDLVFLDIQMPKLTGFELIELIDHKPAIVFVTAYDQFALKAFEVNAADYLLKPVSEKRFDEAMERVLNTAEEDVKSRAKSVSDFAGAQKTLERIVVKEKGEIIILPLSKIMYFEAQDDYIKIVSQQGAYLKKKTMKALEQALPEDRFVRVHRSYIAAVNRISSIELFEKESYRLHLNDGTIIPVSKSGYDTLKKVLDV
jgi:two-component system LytT family response regulator